MPPAVRSFAAAVLVLLAGCAPDDDNPRGLQPGRATAEKQQTTPPDAPDPGAGSGTDGTPSKTDANPDPAVAAADGNPGAGVAPAKPDTRPPAGRQAPDLPPPRPVPPDGRPEPKARPVHVPQLRAVVAPLYLRRAEMTALAERLEQFPDQRQAFVEALRLEAALAREPFSLNAATAGSGGAGGVHTSWPTSPAGPLLWPARGSPQFRRLLGDVQAVRDLALGAAIPHVHRFSAGGGPWESVLRRDLCARRAIAAIRRFTGPGGPAPAGFGRQAVLELGLTVPTLYFAADLLWAHPGWRGIETAPSPAGSASEAGKPAGAIPPEAVDGRVLLCRWAARLADQLQPSLGSRRGAEGAWALHLYVASLVMADRLSAPDGGRLARLRAAIIGEGPASLRGLLAQELSDDRRWVSEEFRPDAPGRSTGAAGAVLLTVLLARQAMPELFPRMQPGEPRPPAAVLERDAIDGLQRQLARLPGSPAPGARPLPVIAVPEAWLHAGRHPMRGWDVVLRFRCGDRLEEPPPPMRSPTPGRPGPAANAADAGPAGPAAKSASATTEGTPEPASAALGAPPGGTTGSTPPPADEPRRTDAPDRAPPARSDAPPVPRPPAPAPDPKPASPPAPGADPKPAPASAPGTASPPAPAGRTAPALRTVESVAPEVLVILAPPATPGDPTDTPRAMMPVYGPLLVLMADPAMIRERPAPPAAATAR